MPAEPPIACSLDASQMSDRLAEAAAIGAESLFDVREQGERKLLLFRAGEGVQSRLERIVAAELECCPFLSLELTAEPDALVLTIAGPDDAQPIVDEMAAAFAS
ncbi:MAG: hypothetical protein H0T15_05870 [Thermoleophilaceae bacterium]|nr:hypothetical protein [Thermoleophilaceae bacterium]